MKIVEPTLLLDKKKCLRNIEMMCKKARQHNLLFRPHFKTHQSGQIGNWFRDYGVNRISVSSLNMAQYFADKGWDDITVAFPLNILEIEKINRLASHIRLNLLVESLEIVSQLRLKVKFPVNLFVKIDVGYHRTGLEEEDIPVIEDILNEINESDLLTFIGFLTHAGHSYHAKNITEIEKIHHESMAILNRLKKRYLKEFPDLIISIGDTPTCSIMNDFSLIDEIRPGNFVFYDLMQWRIGACSLDQIAVVMACPVVAKHPKRSEIVVYGGAVHFSKDRAILPDGREFYGLLVDLHENGWDIPDKFSYLKSLSQEHGVLKVDEEYFNKIQEGDVVGILPIHSCLTANLMKSYLTLDGEIITTM